MSRALKRAVAILAALALVGGGLIALRGGGSAKVATVTAPASTAPVPVPTRPEDSEAVVMGAAVRAVRIFAGLPLLDAPASSRAAATVVVQQPDAALRTTLAEIRATRDLIRTKVKASWLGVLDAEVHGTGTEREVRVWCVAVVAGATASLGGVFTTETLTLVREDAGWRVKAYRSTPGPNPVLVGPAIGAAEALRDFRRHRLPDR